MNTLKTELNKEQILETACRTVARWLGESAHFLSDVPKFKDPETLTALQLKQTVEDYSCEIKRFKDFLENRTYQRLTIVEPTLENQNLMKLKILEETHRKDKVVIQKGLEILEQRRSTYVAKLRLTKLNQFQIGTITREADRINKQAHETLTKIEQLRTAIKEQTKKLTELRAKFNELHEKYQKINLNSDKSFPMFNVEIPHHLTELIK